MASGDNDYQDDSSSGFFTDDLDQIDSERDLYATLHINRDVRNINQVFHRKIPFVNLSIRRLMQLLYNKLIVD